MSNIRPTYAPEIETYALNVLRGKVRSDGEWADFGCKAHSDSSPSARIRLGNSNAAGRIVCDSHGCLANAPGIWVDQYAKECGLPEPPPKRDVQRDKPKEKSSKKYWEWPIVGEYTYTDSKGTPVFLVRKWSNGSDKAVRPHVWWPRAQKWNLGVKAEDGSSPDRVLYRLTKILESEGPVICVEGEKDVHTAERLGFVATTTMMGSKNVYQVKDWSALKGRDVIIVPDFDDAGRAYVNGLKQQLGKVARSIKVLDLGYTDPERERGKDLSDWVAEGGTREKLLALVDATEIDQDASKPHVVTNDRDPQEVDLEVLEILLGCCDYYSSDDNVVQLVEAVTGDTIVRAVSSAEMATTIQENLQLVKEIYSPKLETTIKKPHRPEPALINAAFVNLQRALPRLNRVVQVPFFDREGRLVSTPGYNESTGTYLAQKVAYKVPEAPTDEQIQEALKLLVEELLGEFWWADETSRTHAVCSCLQPFIIDFLNDCTPAYLSAANRPSCGKTYLAQVISRITQGVGAKEISQSKGLDNAELEKKVNSILLLGDQTIIIDNVKSQLEEYWLLNYLSSNLMSVRIFGTTSVRVIPNKHLWFITANTPKLCVEITRRTVPMTLFVPWEIENPSERDFEKRDLKRWVSSNRKRLIEACLTILQAWMKAGAPTTNHHLDSFGRWAQIMGGICEFIGLPGFLETQKKHQEEIDESAMERREIIYSLIEAHGQIRFQDAQFFHNSMEKYDCLPSSINPRLLENQQIRQVGRWLSNVAKCNPKVGDYRVTSSKCKHRKVKLYSIEDFELTTCSGDDSKSGSAGLAKNLTPQNSGGSSVSNGRSDSRGEGVQICGVSGVRKNSNPAANPAEQTLENTISVEICGVSGVKNGHPTHTRDRARTIAIARDHAREGSTDPNPAQPRNEKSGKKIEHSETTPRPSLSPGELAVRLKQLDATISVQRMCGNRAKVEELAKKRAALVALLPAPGADPPRPPDPSVRPENAKTQAEIMDELSDELGGLL